MSNILKTIEFIRQAHEGQIRENTGQPYFTHPLAVMGNLFVAFENVPEDVAIAALLHDVVEDTKYTIEDLWTMGYSKETLDMVSLVSTDVPTTKGMPYIDKIKKLVSAENIGAMMIKYADNMHNISDLTIETDARRFTKYSASMRHLEACFKVRGINVRGVHNGLARKESSA